MDAGDWTATAGLLSWFGLSQDPPASRYGCGANWWAVMDPKGTMICRSWIKDAHGIERLAEAGMTSPGPDVPPSLSRSLVLSPSVSRSTKGGRVARITAVKRAHFGEALVEFMPTQLDRVVARIRLARGIDLSGYRRSTLERRLAVRMSRVRCDDVETYLERLRIDPVECDRLIDAMAINVSAFFRDPVVWETLAHSVLPDILDRKHQARGREIRVWSAGCAAGEEAYSAAVVVHQALWGQRGDRVVHVFATDIDEEALREAVAARYPGARLANARVGTLDRYFIPCHHGYEVRPFIRRMVWFSREDLTARHNVAPAASVFGTFDLIFCRNVLIYFGRELQVRVVDKLVRCLAPGGYLVLGESESLAADGRSRLETWDTRTGIYRKRGWAG